MNYNEAMEYISEINKLGSILGLENMKNLCAQLGNPQKDLPFIHITGTNGKGSTGAFLEGILTEAGYKVGRYISPTLLSYEERYSINGVSISKDELSYFISQAKEGVHKVIEKGMAHPTAFEVETAVGFLYFKANNCDFVLLEVGLGGVTDATNIIEKSIASVITSISLDHTAYLGNSVEEIAEKKAGIIKNDSIIITTDKNLAVMDIIQRVAGEKNSALKIAGAENVNLAKNTFDYKHIKNIELKALGAYQPENACIAAEVALSLRDLGYKIDDVDIKMGLNSVVWNGRFQILSKAPVFIVDGCHNPQGVAMLMQSLDIYYKDKAFVFIMGIFKDKDYKEMVSLSATKAKKIYTVTPPGERGLDKGVLKSEIQKYNNNVEAVELVEAVENCKKEKAAICVAFGSLSYIGQIINMFDNT